MIMKKWKCLWAVLLFVSYLHAQSGLTQIMQNMEYAMGLMQKGFLYNKKEWIQEGLEEFKTLNNQLRLLDPHTYLGAQQRKDSDVVSGIVNKNRDNIEVLEHYLKQNELIKSADACGRILAGCVSCHAISRGW